MERIIQYKINKYATYIDNLQWHIDTNKPTGELLNGIEKKMLCFKEMLNDLKELRDLSVDYIPKEILKTT